MQTAHVILKSISPLLLNPMTDETLDELFAGSGARKLRKTDVTQEAVAAKKVIRDDDGNIGLPVEYLFAALVNAGRFVKFDSKKNFTNATSSLVPGLLTLGEMFYPFKDQKTPWTIDKRRGRLASTGVAVAIIRPKFKDWAIDLTAEFDEAQVSESKIRELFNAAGRFSGLGDFRPACKGPFGRFTIDSWEVVKSEVREAA
ncbi:MAG: hypothetical protein AAB388_03275 [Patescibacteria group bacterium]